MSGGIHAMCESHTRSPKDRADTTQDSITATDLVDELVAAMVAVRIYDRSHPRVKSTVREVQRLHSHLMRSSTTGSLVLGTVDGFLMSDDRPLLGASLGARRLIDALVARSSGGIEMDRELTEEDLLHLLDLLAGPVRERTFQEANRQLHSRGCHTVGLLPPWREGLSSARMVGNADDAPLGGFWQGPAARSASLRMPVQLHQRIVDSLQSASIDVARGGRIDLQGIQSVAQSLTDSVRRDPGGVLELARYERYDAFTFGHSVRVCALALNFASQMTSDLELLYRIGAAGLLHDIGKSLVPFEILHHRGRLSPEQRHEMEKHPALGAEILLGHEGIDDLAVIVSFGHHRTRDGKGYPGGLVAPAQSMVTRLIKICDVFEALTAVRPYKSAMTPIEAFSVMHKMTGHFDPRLFGQFVRLTGCYPAGSLVALSDGSTARVLRQGEDLLRPVVQRQTDREGAPLAEEGEAAVDLSGDGTSAPVTVTSLLELGRISVMDPFSKVS